jgi:hypothetical protein
MIRSSLEDEKEGDEREGLDREEQWWEGQAKQSEDEPDEGGRRGEVMSMKVHHIKEGEAELRN